MIYLLQTIKLCEMGSNPLKFLFLKICSLFLEVWFNSSSSSLYPSKYEMHEQNKHPSTYLMTNL